MKLILTILGTVVILLTVLFLISVNIYNFRSDNKAEAKEFLSGKVPNPSLDGSYNGHQFTGLGKNWLGKQFNSTENNGINNFAGKTTHSKIEQRYPFETYKAQGLRNKNHTVMQLNYNVAGNPWWIKPIRDEVVEVGPDKYLGKIQLKVGFVVVTLGYFRLDK